MMGAGVAALLASEGSRGRLVMQSALGDFEALIVTFASDAVHETIIFCDAP
jgi:hypothetical protein